MKKSVFIFIFIIVVLLVVGDVFGAVNSEDSADEKGTLFNQLKNQFVNTWYWIFGVNVYGDFYDIYGGSCLEDDLLCYFYNGNDWAGGRCFEGQCIPYTWIPEKPDILPVQPDGSGQQPQPPPTSATPIIVPLTPENKPTPLTYINQLPKHACKIPTRPQEPAEIPVLAEVSCNTDLVSLVELYERLYARLLTIQRSLYFNKKYIESEKNDIDAWLFRIFTEVISCNKLYDREISNINREIEVIERAIRENNRNDVLDKHIYDTETGEFSLTEEDIDKLVESIQTMQAVIATHYKVDIDTEKYAVYQDSITVSRDVAIDMVVVIGTAGGSALASAAGKTSIVTTRTLVAAMKEGAYAGLIFGGGTSLPKAIDDVERGYKTTEEAAFDVAVETALSGIAGACIGAGTYGTGKLIATKANSILGNYRFLERLTRGERLLKESNLLPEGKLTKFQKEQILKAHYQGKNIEEKARILKDFTETQKRVLMENWVVGDNLAQEILDSRRVLMKPHELNKVAEKMGYTLKNVKEGKAVIDSSGRVITRIPQHSKDLNKFTAKSILKDLAKAGLNL